MSKKIIVTGVAGFIGFHLAQRLANEGHQVLGIDCVNDYYDVGLKNSRLQILEALPNHQFVKLDIADRQALIKTTKDFQPDYMVNLAAQAGVRYSLKHPEAYAHSNLVGFQNILDAAVTAEVKHLVFASTSSVYGANQAMPFSIHHNTNHQISIYAATKKANEVMAHSYSAMHQLPCTGLRFFTVYGPWGRPDMAMFIFTKALLEGTPLPLFNRGDMARDFTFVDDIVEGICRLIPTIATPDPNWDAKKPSPATSCHPWRIYNIGNSVPEKIMDMISHLENFWQKKAKLELLPMQIGDVSRSDSDISDLERVTGFHPRTSLKEGIDQFCHWYKDYYQIKS